MRAHDEERLAKLADEGGAVASGSRIGGAGGRAQAGVGGAQSAVVAPAPGRKRRLEPALGPARFARPRAALLGALGICASGCSELTSPPSHRAGGSATAEQVLAPSPPAPQNIAVADPPPSAPVPAEQIEASHILVSYQGATRAKPTVTRTRGEARELAEKLAARAREPGTDFAQLAKEASDGPSGVEGGALPRFGRQQMVKPFSDAAFALRPGEVSGVVETNFGFHVIKRTQ
jgi:parvulin-like peptidyl-prolyl isomerase